MKIQFITQKESSVQDSMCITDTLMLRTCKTLTGCNKSANLVSHNKRTKILLIELRRSSLKVGVFVFQTSIKLRSNFSLIIIAFGNRANC